MEGTETQTPQSELGSGDIQPDIKVFERSELSIVTALESFEAYLISLKDFVKNARQLNQQVEVFYTHEGGRFGGIVDSYAKSNYAILPLIEKEVKDLEQAFEGTRKRYKAVTQSFRERFVVRTAVEKQYKSVEQSYKKALKKSLTDSHSKKKEAYQKIKKLHDNFNQDFANDLDAFSIQRQDPFDPTLVALVGMQASMTDIFTRQSPRPSSILKQIKDSIKSTDKGPESVNTTNFRNFLQSEHSEENLNFYLESEKYKKLDEDAMKTKAKELFGTYVKSGAKTELNISASTKTKVAKLLDSPDYTPDETTFRSAAKEVFVLMERDSFDRFKNSDFFKNLQKRLQVKDFSTFERPTELEQLLAEVKKIKVTDHDVPTTEAVGWVYTHSIEEQSADASKKKYALVRSKSFTNVRKTQSQEVGSSTQPTSPKTGPIEGFVKKLAHTASTRFLKVPMKSPEAETKIEPKETEKKPENNETKTDIDSVPKIGSSGTDSTLPRHSNSETSPRESEAEDNSTHSSPILGSKAPRLSTEKTKKKSFIWNVFKRKDKKEDKKSGKTPQKSMSSGSNDSKEERQRRETADTIKKSDLLDQKEKEEVLRGRSSTVATPTTSPNIAPSPSTPSSPSPVTPSTPLETKKPQIPIAPQNSMTSMQPSEVMKDTPLSKEQAQSSPTQKETQTPPKESELEPEPQPQQPLVQTASKDSSDTVSEEEIAETKDNDKEPSLKKETSITSFKVPAILNEPPKESKESPKESPKEVPKESPKEAPKESPREARKETPNGNAYGTPNGTSNESATSKQTTSFDDGINKFLEEQKRIEEEAKAKALVREQRRKQRELELQKEEELESQRLLQEKEKRKKAALESQKELEEAEKRAEEATKLIHQAMK